MGSVEYMRNLRKRYISKGHADETDTIPMETSGDEGENGMPLMQEATTTHSSAESVSGMVDSLKAEHLGCLEHPEFWDANATEGVILQFLKEIRGSSGSNILCDAEIRFQNCLEI